MSEQPEIIAEIVEDRRDRGRQRHGFFLALATIVAVLAWSLEVRPDERVAFRGFSQWPLPHSCYSRIAFGVPCPGCGLTRSVICLMHGELAGSMAMHRLGWLIFGAIVLQIPYRLLALAGHEPRWGRDRVMVNAVWITALVLLLINRLLDAFGWT